jgi:ABC-type sugar transport system substrate-binding protein
MKKPIRTSAILFLVVILTITIISVGCKATTVETTTEETTATETTVAETTASAETTAAETEATMKETEESYPIADFLTGYVGKISREEYKPVVRPAKKEYSIVFGTFAEGNWEIWNTIEKNMKDVADEMGCKFQILDNKQDAQVAITNARLVVDMKPDIFLEANLFAEANQEISAMMIEAQIPCVGIDIYVPDMPYYHVPDYEQGYQSVDWLAKYAIEQGWVEGDISFVWMDQQSGASSDATRKEGAYDALKANLNLTEDQIFDVGFPSGTVDATQEEFRVWLTAHPDAHNILIAGTHDACVLGPLAALKELKRESDAYIISSGGDLSAVAELVKNPNGPLKAVLSTMPQNRGQIMIPYAVDIMEGNPVPTNVTDALTAITPENVAGIYPDQIEEWSK